MNIILSVSILLGVEIIALTPYALLDLGYSQAAWSLSSLEFNSENVPSLFAIVVVSLSNALLLLGVSGGLKKCGKRIGSRISALVYACYTTSLLLDAFYVIKFGVAPSPLLILDFFYGPVIFLKYTEAGMSSSEITWFVTLLVLCYGVCQIASRLSGLQFASWKKLAFIICIALFGIWAAQSFIFHLGIPRYLALKRGAPPVFRWYASGFYHTEHNDFASLQPYYPSCQCADPYPNDKKPRHIILIVADGLRADHIPQYGYQRATIPNILSESDRWGFSNSFFSHAPYTGKSFPTIFSGKYYIDGTGIREDTTHFWEQLRLNKIRSGFFSSSSMRWGHLDEMLSFDKADNSFTGENSTHTLQRSFTSLAYDFTIDDFEAVKQYVTFLDTARDTSFAALYLVSSHYPFFHDNKLNRFSRPQEPPDRVVAESSPLLMTSYHHLTHEVSSKEIAFNIDSYDDSIVYVDSLVAEVKKALLDRGILEDSVIILTSDHGEAWGEHGYYFHGTSLFQEQIHIPFLYRVGSNLVDLRKRMDKSRDQLGGLVDLVPTIFDAFGLPQQKVDGCSLISECKKPYELMLYNGMNPLIGVVRNNRKYIFDLSYMQAMEFDLHMDRGEERNLWTNHTESLKEFVAALHDRNIIVSRGQERR